MGIFKVTVLGIWPIMTVGSPLAQPIRGEVSRDGRLIRADDALRRLHLRAGGVAGGFLAIPPLDNLAQLAIRLKMRLSRSIRVADDDDNLELWVEVEPKGDVAHLAIISWRTLPPAFAAKDQHRLASQAFATLVFDAAFRLIKASGVITEGLSRSDFGKTADDILPRLFEGCDEVATILAKLTSYTGFSEINLGRRFNSSIQLVTGAPMLNAEGTNIGYIFHIEENSFAEKPTPSTPSNVTPGALFGKHLAPVLLQPLGRIIANAETIGGELQGPIRENYAVYARDIANAARHLTELVDDLGDLEAVEREDFITARDMIELGDVARRVSGLLALKAADHSIRILTPSDRENVPAVAEFRRVLQVMLNLVTNAVRYSPDGTEVSIDIAANDDAAFISVSDQGAGIAEENRDKVFEKFERLGRSGDGGSGLGLYISRRLARAMGGELTVEESASGGAKFTLRLPTH